MKDKKKLITFDERNICVLLFNLRHVIHIPSFGIVNLLCCGGPFSSMTFTDAKIKYRSPYLLEVFQPYLQNHIRTSVGHAPQTIWGRRHNVCRRRSFTVTYRTLWRRPQDIIFQRPKDVGRGSRQHVGRDVPWSYIEDHMGTLLGTSSGRFRDVIIPSGTLPAIFFIKNRVTIAVLCPYEFPVNTQSSLNWEKKRRLYFNDFL